MQGPLWRCSTTKLLGWLASSVWGTLCGSAVQCSAVYALELTLETCCNFRVITSDLITRECPCYYYILERLAMPLHELPSPACPVPTPCCTTCLINRPTYLGTSSPNIEDWEERKRCLLSRDLS